MKTEQELKDELEDIFFDALTDKSNPPYYTDKVDPENDGYWQWKVYELCADELIKRGYGDISEYKAEIERLKAENEKLLDSIESVQAGRCRLRCPLTEQAVKEFAERLKKYSYTDNCFKDGKWHRYVLVSDIDELIGGKEK